MVAPGGSIFLTFVKHKYKDLLAVLYLWSNPCVTKMITACSPMIGQLFDTVIVASSDKEWL